jgi:hypothetical protein
MSRRSPLELIQVIVLSSLAFIQPIILSPIDVLSSLLTKPTSTDREFLVFLPDLLDLPIDISSLHFVSWVQLSGVPPREPAG